jgi:hypothetical protein
MHPLSISLILSFQKCCGTETVYINF